MAKKVDNKRKLKSLKNKRNVALISAGLGGALGGYGGYKISQTGAMGEQLSKIALERIRIEAKALKGEKLTEDEAKIMNITSNEDGWEKIRGAAYQSPKTKKAKILGGVGGSIFGAAPGLLSAAINQHKINKLEKQIAKEAEEKDFSDDEDYIVPSDDRIKEMTRFQVLRVLDKRDKQVDRDRKKYIKRKTRNSGIFGSILGAGLGALTGYYGSKYALGDDDRKRTISNSVLSGLSGALVGYGIGKNTGKKNAEDYVKDADEFNNRKVTRKLAKHLDKIMREQGREDDLEILNEEKFRNQKNAKREYESFTKGNNVLNLGRNSVRVIK